MTSQEKCDIHFSTGLGPQPTRHFDGQSIKVEQFVWRGRIQFEGKTRYAYRTVELYPAVAEMLSHFIGERTKGFIFRTERGGPLWPSNFLRRELHPVLEALGLKRGGFHAFRRFRTTYLRNHTNCPEGVRKFWLGWAVRDMSDRYDKSSQDPAFRREVAKNVGIGFVLPKSTSSKTPGCSNNLEREESL
jgi:integrase